MNIFPTEIETEDIPISEVKKIIIRKVKDVSNLYQKKTLSMTIILMLKDGTSYHLKPVE